MIFGEELRITFRSSHREGVFFKIAVLNYSKNY